MDDQEKIIFYQSLQKELKDSLTDGGEVRQRRKRRTIDQLADSSKKAWAEVNRPADEVRVVFRAPAELIEIVDQMRKDGESRKDWLISAISEKIKTCQNDREFRKFKM